MKKLTFTFLMIFALTLTACGTAAETEIASTSTLSTDYENALSVQLQLSIGTFELEGTGLAVDAAQAAELIPLWQVLKSLTESDSAAQEEIEALVAQIEETMTTEQIEAVDAMQLTREDMGAVMQEYGFQPESRSGETPPEGVTLGQGRGSGSGVPGMGGGPGGGEAGLMPEQIAAMQAEREANGGGNMLNNRISSVIIEGLIEYLTSLTD